MELRQDIYPEDRTHNRTMVTFFLHRGMAKYMWDYIMWQEGQGEQPEPQVDPANTIWYANFARKRIIGKTAEEIGTLLVTIQDFKETAPSVYAGNELGYAEKNTTPSTLDM